MSNDKDQSMVEKNLSKICLVCGSGDAQKNYGAFTCSPCKVFFRRNIHLDLIKNQCEKNGECQININNRIICRVCRLKKCLSVGMTEDLFRSSHKRISTKESENENKKFKTHVPSIINDFELTFDEQIILLNLDDSYDICSPISNINKMIQISSNNPSKIRLKTGKNNLMIIQSYLSSSVISFIKINNKFNSLSNNDRRILIQRHIHHLIGLNQLFIYNEIHFLNDPIENSIISNEYGSLYLENLLNIIKKMPEDKKLIKLFLIILIFSTCSDIIHFNLNQFSKQHNYLSSVLNIFNIQNVYVEILYKYLINNYDYANAPKEFDNLIKIVLTQNTYLEISLTNEKYHQTIETILNQIEQDYKMDYDEFIESSN